MEIVIHQTLFNTLVEAVESQRPELLAAHTTRYTKRIPFPFNTNRPLDSIVLEMTQYEIDYDIRANNVRVGITPEYIQFVLSLDAAVTRTGKEGSEEVRFQVPLEMRMKFKPSDGNRYPLSILGAVMATLEPVGLRPLVSWVFSETLSAAIQETGLPESVVVIKDELRLTLSPPTLGPGRINLTGKFVA